MKSNRLIHVLILTALISLLFGIQYFSVFQSPNKWFLSGEGDGPKNYYTPWYHVLHDSSSHWFGGMNYPYGEHVVYSDAQPVISNSLRFIHQNIFPIGAQTPGILNLLMLLSVFWAGWLIYLVLRRWQLPGLYSAVCAGLIASLSPQIFRFNGHYALAYACVVPLIWYCIIRFREKPGYVWSGVLAVTGIVLSGIHPYYLMIYAIFLAAIWFFDLVLPGKKREWKVILPHLLIQLILPILFFKLYLSLTDPVTDRPETPYGFFAYRSSWKSVFFSYIFPWVQTARKAMGMGPVHPEGYAYVGFPGLIALFAVLWHLLKNLIRRTWRGHLKPFENREKNIVFFSAIVIFLFASGYLFPGNLGKIVSELPLISQFRSTGRFAWIFFYLWTVISVVWLWEWSLNWRKAGKSIQASLILILPLAVMAGEAGYYNFLIRRDYAKVQPIAALMEESQNLTKGLELSPKTTDALLFLPYYHIGSENFSSLRRSSMTPDLLLSIQTGLPMMNTSLSRTSFSQAWKLIQFPLAQISEPEIMQDLPAQVRICVVENSESIQRGLGIPWLLPENATAYTDEKRIWWVDPEGVKLGKNWLSGQFTGCISDTSHAPFTLAHISGDSIQGDFSAVFTNLPDQKKPIPLLSIDLPPKDSVKYSFSIWAKMRKDQSPVSRLFLLQKPEDGRPEWKVELFVQVWVKAMVGEWALIEVPAQPPYGDLPLQIEWGMYGDPSYLELRSWLLRSRGANICTPLPEPFKGQYWNNYLSPFPW